MSGIRRILIVGVSSHLGSALAVGLRDYFEVFGTYYSNPLRVDGVTAMRLDLTNGGDVLEAVKRSQPDVVLFCAGVHDRIKAETNQALADAVNLKAATLFFKIQNNPSHFIYFSIDEVVGIAKPETPALLTESAPSEPLNVLGWTKSQGENLTLSVRNKTHVLRLGTVFGESGGTLHRPRRSWIGELIRKLELGQSVSASPELWRTPLFLGDFVRSVSLFLANLPAESGLWNLAGPTGLSEYAAFKAVAERFCPAQAHLVRPLASQASSVPRPDYACLDSKKFCDAYAFEFQSFEASLDELQGRLKSGNLMSWSIDKTAL
jgi:dTDP-4-dehydrorhamnose reductase